MSDGTICIHTSHNPDICKKIKIDFNSLKAWIVNYYINKNTDPHYEHLIVPGSKPDEDSYAYIFNDVDYKFKRDEFGFVNLSFLRKSKSKEKYTSSYLVQKFINEYGDEIAVCEWSTTYKNMNSSEHGLFIFIENSPAIHNRFIYKDWKNFDNSLKHDFLKFLHNCEKKYLQQKRRDQQIPLFIGYRISDLEVHWQVAQLEIGNFPIEGIKENQVWYSSLTDGEIKWATSINSSYKYFFGRGAFSKNLVNKRILILGVGAIGSIVARTLTKGGCKKIDLADYDIKMPENICRAEFQFATGIVDKVDELSDELAYISPFIEIGLVNQMYFEVISKALFQDLKPKAELEDFLNSYDLVFDCTTDNDLMFILNSLSLKNDMINLSITNHSKDLVCAFHPNIYDFVTKQFSEILDNNLEDLYNPTGCWSPTFKASYNNINLLVQYALSQINLVFEDNNSKNNFVIETNTADGININLKQY